nr:metallophosphatase family protein [Verrucomicrobiota bacterium]
MRIAVLSDTHNRLPEDVCTAVAGADEIWHLGDVMEPRVIARLQQLGSPMRVVRGNCDQHDTWPLLLEFTLEGFRIVLVHIPPRKAPPAADLLFHGHTHVPRNELVGPTR